MTPKDEITITDLINAKFDAVNSQLNTITIVDLINAKFEGVGAQLKTITGDIQEIKNNCKERGSKCGSEFKVCDVRIDALEQAKVATNTRHESDQFAKKFRFDRYQIISNGIAGILGAIAAYGIMLLRGVS